MWRQDLREINQDRINIRDSEATFRQWASGCRLEYSNGHRSPEWPFVEPGTKQEQKSEVSHDR